ncbi:hypothetical protein K435DRAFT_811830 [Dendrothele bispora CBS 962.96]|uniref:Uncharacterized protein n=1 Tax=Dendrothele bispora (strain CBS 962.96) TaxID=1314807 RepID=A0A4S8KR29_DENBC|nr:hypothetical protein K435DRAFT_811830 [Dendrothele bispora CBS 962.96]
MAAKSRRRNSEGNGRMYDKLVVRAEIFVAVVDKYLNRFLFLGLLALSDEGELQNKEGELQNKPEEHESGLNSARAFCLIQLPKEPGFLMLGCWITFGANSKTQQNLVPVTNSQNQPSSSSSLDNSSKETTEDSTKCLLLKSCGMVEAMIETLLISTFPIMSLNTLHYERCLTYLIVYLFIQCLAPYKNFFSNHSHGYQHYTGTAVLKTRGVPVSESEENEKKEQADGDYSNLVFIVMEEKNLGLQDAIDYVITMLSDRVDEYIILVRSLPHGVSSLLSLSPPFPLLYDSLQGGGATSPRVNSSSESFFLVGFGGPVLQFLDFEFCKALNLVQDSVRPECHGSEIAGSGRGVQNAKA